MAVTKNKKRIDKQKHVKNRVHEQQVSKLVNGYTALNAPTDILYVEHLLDVTDILNPKKYFKVSEDTANKLRIRENEGKFLGRFAGQGIAAIDSYYGGKEVPYYSFKKQKQILDLYMVTKHEYQEILNLKGNAKYFSYVYKNRFLPGVLKEEQERKRKIYDRQKFLDEINSNLDKYDPEMGLRDFINSLDTRAFFKKPWDGYKKFPYLNNLFSMQFQKDKDGNDFLLVLNSDILAYFHVYNWDLFKVAFALKDDRDVVNTIANKTKVDLSTSYEGIYDRNIRFLENLNSHKNDYPYTHKFLKSGVPGLIALNKEHKLLAREDSETFNGMPMVYTAMSYLAKKAYPDKDPKNVKPNLSRQLSVYNFLGVLSIVPMPSIPKKELAYAIEVAKKRNTLNITNYYSIYDLEENIDEIEKIAEFAYKEGLRLSHMPKDRVKDIYKAYEEHLKSTLEYSPDEKEYVIYELNRLRDVCVTNLSPISIYDAIEYLRNETMKDFCDEAMEEAKKKVDEFKDLELSSLFGFGQDSFGLDADNTLQVDGIAHFGMAKSIKFNKFYTFLKFGYGLSDEMLEKRNLAKRVNWIYTSFGDTILFPDNNAVDRRLVELKNLFFYKLDNNSSEEDIKNYDIYKGLLDKHSFLDYYKESKDNHFKAVMDYLRGIKRLTTFDFIYMKQYKILSGEDKTLLPYYNYSSEVLKKVKELDRIVMNNYRTYSLKESYRSYWGRDFVLGRY